MTKRLLIECERCGQPFIFTVIHADKAQVEKHLDWALEHVTLCHDCRPYYGHYNFRDRRPGIGGTDYL